MKVTTICEKFGISKINHARNHQNWWLGMAVMTITIGADKPLNMAIIWVIHKDLHQRLRHKSRKWLWFTKFFANIVGKQFCILHNFLEKNDRKYRPFPLWWERSDRRGKTTDVLQMHSEQKDLIPSLCKKPTAGHRSARLLLPHNHLGGVCGRERGEGVDYPLVDRVPCRRLSW